MKGIRSLAAATVFGLTIAASVGARADDQKDIASLYSALRQALITNHPEATIALETPDFKAKGLDGRVLTGQQLVQQMKMQSQGAKLKKMDIKIEKLNVKGKTADATTSFSAAHDLKDAQGKAHVMAMTGTIHNTLAKTAHGWKFKTMEEAPGKMTVDGKPFDVSRMGGAPPRK